MTDLTERIDNYYLLTNEEKKAEAKALFGETGEGLVPYLYSEVRRGALRIIADSGVKAESLVHKNERLFKQLLSCEDDSKTRMLTAEILGHAGGYTKELIRACREEQTMYTLPSYLLAIGASKENIAKNFLSEYEIRSDQPKHIAAEKAALNKALANFIKRDVAVIHISKGDIILLECPNAEVTLDEATDKGFNARKTGKYVLISEAGGFSSIYSLRTFSCAYVLLGKCSVNEVQEKLTSLVPAIRARVNVSNYRLEIAGVSHEERTKFIPGWVDALEGLINTPSSYSFEIKIQIAEDSAIILLNPMNDKRFAYRKKAISASVSPAVAASVCYTAHKYFSIGSRVLDNFCGSGTMLFERSFYPHFSLTGVDIAQDALKCAKENAEVLKCPAKFIHADALRFDGKMYDEIICNMPFGIRVSNHAKNEKLYSEYIKLLPQILKPGGYAFLYTHEKHLLEDMLKKYHIRYESKTMYEAGGLYPVLYIICNK